MHVRDEVVHVHQQFLWLRDHQIGALGHDVEVIVGYKCGNFDDDMDVWVQPRHLQVHPNQHFSNLFGVLDSAGSGEAT